MSEQEEYLDKLLSGLNGEPEEEALEDFSFEDVDMNEMEDIDEENLFDDESSEFEDVDSLVLEGTQQELDSESDVLEFGFSEDDFQLDEEDLDFAYEDTEEEDLISDALFENEEEDLDPDLEALFENIEDETENLSEIGTEPEADEFQMFEEPEPEMDESQMFEEPEPEMDEFQMFEEPEPEMDEFQMFEEPESEMDESQMFEETEPDDGMLDMGLDNLESEEEVATTEGIEGMQEEISDEEALANILNTFSGDENDRKEESLIEEAVLDTPEDLGLELEEVEGASELMEEEESKGKKKRARKKRKKTQEENLGDLEDLGDITESVSKVKKPSLLARLLEDNADDEPTPEELEAEAAKKVEKEEQKQAKKEAAEEKKQQAKEAAAAKKAEKEAEKKRKKEMEEPPEPWPPFTKKVIPMIFLFGAALAVLIVIFSSVLSYSPYVSNARRYFDNRQYEKAYDQLLGIEIKEKDQNFYNQVLLMNQLQVKVTSSKNHLSNKEKELAVNDLVQAVLFYNDNLEKAEKLGLLKEFQVVYANIEADLSESFGLSVEDAEELGAIADAAEYQERIAEIVK